MYHSALIFTLGILVGLTSWIQGGECAWLGFWLTANLIWLGIAYARRGSDVFGKQANGSLSKCRTLLFLPWLLFTWSVWRLSLLLPEPKTHRINEKLTIGRRLIRQELPAGITAILDMTAEFPEPASVRRGTRYLCLPTLDASAPSPDALLATIHGIKPEEHVFIHCAQGHGRTGLAAIALLLHRGVVGEIEEGLVLLRNIRPGIRLSSVQRSCWEKCLAQLRSGSPISHN